MRCLRTTPRTWLLLLSLLGCSPVALSVTKSATIGLSAEVLPACSAGSTAPATLGQFGTLNFGTYFSLNTLVSATSSVGNGSLRINCLLNTPYRVLLSAGGSGNVAARRMTGPAAAQINYNLYTSAAYTTVWDNTTGVTGTGTGADQYLQVFGRVPKQAAPTPGTYTDTITVTVSW
ncbi:spore coat U domain-containing protein [Pseudomonas sp. GV071]|uniref:Csu type fimbrial protein n=1 Tax=Pseudomonas sp. GV071 TaxID=2135754 RepID=UPI000D3A1C1E|nr:spore coat U domain-containing protein [Pseudomonas sp. GV071]PTQ67599.1 spore coat protein U-like protein [Pseudomonas sp. GV071]